MALSAPRLSREDLEGELSRLHADKHRSLHTAFFGTGDALDVHAKVLGEPTAFRAQPVDCELRLREVLAEAEGPVVLLVDYTDRLPLDVQGRLATGCLQFISRERRLANLFGAKAVAPPLLDSPLAEALLGEGLVFRPPIEGSTVDLHTAWRRYLQRRAELSLLGDLSEEVVVAHCATRAYPVALRLELASHPALGEATRAYVRAQAGPVAEIAWRAWEAGEGQAVGALAFVLDALLPHWQDGYVRAFLQGELKGLIAPAQPTDAALLARWAGLAPALALRFKGDALERVLADADKRVGAAELESHLAGGRYLGAALRASKQRLAQRLDAAVAAAHAQGEGQVALEDARAALEAYQAAARHRLADRPEHAAELERARMAVRLLAYLAMRAAGAAQKAEQTALEAAYEIADHFCTDGGFVDYARRLVRGGQDGSPWSLSLSRVVEAVDRVRDALDARFAQGLARWNLDRKEGRLLPIEKALQRLGVDFLEGTPERRLLILVMDGMAWSTAAELLLHLQDLGVGPLRWSPKHKVSSGMPAPMIAALPTVTEVSRAALFAGKLPKPGEKLSTLADPERLAEHQGFVRAFGTGPRLLLRTEAEDNAGHVTREALELVRSPDRVVAVVANAVDDMLSAKPSYQGPYNRQTIKALGPLLREARDAKRAILFLADHGHVLSDRDRSRVKVEGADSPRYRELSEGAPASARELVLEGPHAYCSKKSRRLALLYAEADRYRDVHHLGEHGGASLSEVVTPALLLGGEELFQAVGDEDDSGLETATFPLPAWWQLELPPAAKSVTLAPKVRSAPPKKGQGRDASPQLGWNMDGGKAEVRLPPPAPTAAPAEPTVASRWAERLEHEYARESKERREELRKHVLPVVEYLIAHGGRMSVELLAGKLGEQTRNVGGLVAIAGEFLNLDGYEVVRHDAAAKQVELNQSLLEELFGGEDV